MKQEQDKRTRLTEAVTIAADLRPVHDNQSFQALMAGLEKNWLDALLNCQPDDDAARRWHACNVQTVRYIRSAIAEAVAEGERAQRNLAEFE